MSMRAQQVLLVLPLAIYTRHFTRSSHINLGSIYDLLPQVVIPMPLVVRSMCVYHTDVPMSSINYYTFPEVLL